jgi:uncharacterized OB-fold protein
MTYSASRARGPATPFWQAAAAGRLVLPHCSACGRFQWPPRTSCKECRNALEWREASGRGCVAAYSVVRRAPSAELAQCVPYVVAFVALEEGVRLFTSIVDVEPEALHCGMRVQVRFRPGLDPESMLPVFAPAPSSASSQP